jgi:uncharacterized protein (TIRG00374 family)
MIFSQISINELVSKYSNINLIYILLALIAFAIGYAVRIERWRSMLVLDNPNLKWSTCLYPFMICVAANNLLPLRAGDLLRAFRFNQLLNIYYSASVATLIVERLLDLLMLLILFGITLMIFGNESLGLIGLGGASLFIFAAFFLLVFLLPVLFKPIFLSLFSCVFRGTPKIKASLLKNIEAIFILFEKLAKGRALMRLFLLTVLAWTAEGIVFWICAIAFPTISFPYASWLALPLGSLATIIPSTPGYIGTFDYFTAQAMTLLGNDVNDAIAYAFLVHAVLWLPATLVGIFCFLWLPVKQKS